MWKKGQYVSHPHEMGDILLKDWGNIWTQKSGQDLATRMWGRIRQLIITSSRYNRDMYSISVEDVIRGIKMMSSGTAFGIDQWPLATGNNSAQKL